MHLVLEWADVKLIEKSSLGGVNLVASFDDSDGADDFNLSLHNLGLDLLSLEESGLLRVKTGWAGGDNDISGGNRADLGWSLS